MEPQRLEVRVTSGEAYDKARECLRLARAHITEWPASLDGWARKVHEARYWRSEARRLR